MRGLLSIRELGLICIILNIVGLILIFKSKNNYPQDPSIVVHNRRSLWFAKIVLSLFMMLTSLMPVNISVISGIFYIFHLLGPLYFPTALIIDVLAYTALHSKEWCNQDLAIALNFVNMPLITLLAGAYVYASSRKIGARVRAASLHGIVLGHITMAVRRVTSMKIPETYLGTDMVLQSEKWEVRKTPRQTPYIYDPESRSNPHICITGSSGVGKTTATIYVVSELLKRGYPVIVFDPKGDISMTALIRGWHEENDVRKKKVLMLDIEGLGVDPLQPVSDESFMERVSDLINAMSVVEEVGANQKYLIIRSAQEVEDETYKALLSKIREHVDSFLKADRRQPTTRYGPHVRDAYMGIRSKMEILSTVFKEDPKLDASILNPEKWPQDIAGVIVNLSRIRDRYARAVVMELLLRKLEQMLRERGPLAFLMKRRVFIVVDEAHELARSQRWREDVTSSILEDMAREARSHGAALIIVTQRLSDIPDGIRMNMGLWLSLRTDSPQDIHILRTVIPVGRLPEIVTSLPEGHAIVVEAMPQRLDRMVSIPSKPMAVEEAYIVRLERKMAEIGGSVEKAVSKLREALDKAGREAEKMMAELLPINGQVEANPIGKDGDGGGEVSAYRSDNIVDTVISRTLKQLKDQEKKRVLERIPREVVQKYLENCNTDPEELPTELQKLFTEHGLLRRKDGRETAIASFLRKVYLEVAGSG